MKTRFVQPFAEVGSKWFLLLLVVELVSACGESAGDDGQDESGMLTGNPTMTDPQSGSAMPSPSMPSASMPTPPSPGTSPMSATPTPATASSTATPQTPMPTLVPSVSSMPTIPLPPAGTGGTPVGNAGAPAMGSAGGENAGAPSVGGMNGTGGTAEGGAGGTVTVGGDFTLTSEDYLDGEMIPDEFTCEGKAFGEGISPQLGWSGAPEGTLSFALTFIDVTLTEQVPPNMNGYHWAMWDIPASIMSLPQGLAEGATLTDPEGAKQYSPLSPVYLGPCPSFGQMNMDTYEFTLYALDVETLSNSPSDVAELEQLFLEHALATAKLSGWSDAAPQ